MVLKLGYFGKLIISTRKVLKCAKEGWKRSVSWIAWKMKKYYTESRGKVTVRRGRRLKQLVDDLKKGRRYWKLKEEALDRTLRRTRFVGDFGPFVRETTEWMNEWIKGFFLSPQPICFFLSFVFILPTCSHASQGMKTKTLIMLDVLS